jgi:hypothetical protein
VKVTPYITLIKGILKIPSIKHIVYLDIFTAVCFFIYHSYYLFTQPLEYFSFGMNISMINCTNSNAIISFFLEYLFIGILYLFAIKTLSLVILKVSLLYSNRNLSLILSYPFSRFQFFFSELLSSIIPFFVSSILFFISVILLVFFRFGFWFNSWYIFFTLFFLTQYNIIIYVIFVFLMLKRSTVGLIIALVTSLFSFFLDYNVVQESTSNIFLTIMNILLPLNNHLGAMHNNIEREQGLLYYNFFIIKSIVISIVYFALSIFKINNEDII